MTPASAFPTVFQLVEIERARIATSLARIYRIAGFQAAVDAQHGVLQALAEQVREEGGDLNGFCP